MTLGVDVCQELVQLLVGLEDVVASHFRYRADRPDATPADLLVQRLMPPANRRRRWIMISSVSAHSDHPLRYQHLAPVYPSAVATPTGQVRPFGPMPQ